MDVSFELYRVFYFVTKAGSISNAAKNLYISQSAVSQSIKQLEEKLGGQLFFRTSKGIILTAEGEMLYKYIEQAYNFIITAENRFVEMQNLLTGEIRIGASDTLCKYYLLPQLKSFHENYPHINIQVTNRTSQETIKLLKGGKVDIGFINLPVEYDTQLVIKEVLSVQDCFAAGEKYKHLSEREIDLHELEKYPVLMLEKGSSIRQFIDDYTETNNVSLIPEIELGSIDLLVEFAKIGMGVSCVIRNFIHNELSSSQLFEIKLKEKIPTRNIGVITLKNVPLSTATRKFLEYL